MKRTPLKRTSFIKRRSPRHAPKADDKARFAAIHAINGGYWCAVGESGWAHECSGTTTVSHRPGAGMSLRSKHDRVAAICTAHHLNGPHSIEKLGGVGWQEVYGPHEKYEQMTKEKLDE